VVQNILVSHGAGFDVSRLNGPGSDRESKRRKQCCLHLKYYSFDICLLAIQGSVLREARPFEIALG